MSRKSSFRGPFDKWHGKQAETLLELERQHLYHIYWSLGRQFRLRKHLWVIWKILGLFVNPFTVNDKYCLLNRGDLLQHFQIQLSKKQKVLSECFLDFLNLNPIFIIFEKKWPSHLMYFWTYGLRKTPLDKCLKSPVSEEPSTTDVVNGSKHCWKLNDSTFTIFIDPCECNSGRKSLSDLYPKS